ncbi:MAG: transposase [Steroidobacteraceae bacterium]
MNTTIIERRRRRRHSAEFKAETVAACREPGVSIAAVGTSRSVNANLLRRWVVEAQRSCELSRTSAQDFGDGRTICTLQHRLNPRVCAHSKPAGVPR